MKYLGKSQNILAVVVLKVKKLSRKAVSQSVRQLGNQAGLLHMSGPNRMLCGA